MRRLTAALAACLGALTFTPTPARAQSYVALGAGAQLPTGEYAG